MGRFESKWSKRFAPFLLLSSFAGAAVLVNPPSPLPQHNIGEGTSTINIAGSSNTPVVGIPPFTNSTQGYRFITTTASDAANLVWLDVRSNQNLTVNPGQRIVVTLSVGTTAGSEIPLIGAGIVSGNSAPAACGNGNCQGLRNGVSTNLSAIYSPNSTLRLSFRVLDLCSTTGATGTLCTNSNYSNFPVTGGTFSQSIIATFSVVSNAVDTGAVSGANTDSGTFTLSITDVAPTISCPVSGNIADFYFPGDQQIYLTPSKYVTSAGSGTYEGAPLKYLVFLGDRTAVTPFSSGQVPPNEVIAYADINAGTQAIEGFVNTQDGVTNGYDAAVYVQNEVGILSPVACNTFPAPVYAVEVKGVLSESKCFIATAAFHDGRAAPVMMLRKFRDRILSQFEAGRTFIETYYRYSPALAEWAWDKPLIRALALRALIPVEVFAWAVLKFASAEEASPQPYIDRIKRELPDGGAKTEGTYIEEEKKKLPPSSIDQAAGYTERLKAEIGEGRSAEGYVESERGKLPEERRKGSLIDQVKSGTYQPPEIVRPDVKQAIGFMFGVSTGAEVFDTAGSYPFESIYGSGWKPEMSLHYERQLFHSENLGSLGLGVDAGFSYADGYGQLSFPFGGVSQSQTEFTFYQFPLFASAYYRFNLLRVIRPYVGAGAGGVFYLEARKDGVKDKKGVSMAFATHFGASLLLDFFDRTTAQDGYLSLGIQHTYLFAEYLYLNTFNQTGVVFGRSGIYAGFLFEI